MDNAKTQKTKKKDSYDSKNSKLGSVVVSNSAMDKQMFLSNSATDSETSLSKGCSTLMSKEKLSCT